METERTSTSGIAAARVADVHASVGVDVVTRSGVAKRIVLDVPIAVRSLQGGRSIVRYADAAGRAGTISGCQGIAYRPIVGETARTDALDFSRTMGRSHAVTGGPAPPIDRGVRCSWDDPELAAAYDIAKAAEQVAFLRRTVPASLMLVDGDLARPVQLPVWIADPVENTITLKAPSCVGVARAFQFAAGRLDEAVEFLTIANGREPTVAGRVEAVDPGYAADDLPGLATCCAEWVAAKSMGDVLALGSDLVRIWHDMFRAGAEGSCSDAESARRLLADTIHFVDAVQAMPDAGLRCREEFDGRWRFAALRATMIEGVVPAADSSGAPRP
jgi:hypothetical protein